MTIYTIIAYKESGYDRRREEYHHSELDCIQIFEDVDGAANQIFRYKLENKNQDAWLPEWEYQLLVDGRDWDYWRIDFWDDDLEVYKESDPFEAVHQKTLELFDEWLSKAKEREEAAKAEAAAQKVRDQAAAERASIAAEKKLLAKLKEKYPE